MDRAHPERVAAPTAAVTAPRPSLRWAVGLGLVGVAVGALAGWRARPPLYRAEALISVAPSLPSPSDPAGLDGLPMFRAFVAMQVQLMQSLQVAHAAVESDAWRATGRGTGPEAVSRIVAHRSTVHDPESAQVTLRFVDPQPDVALAGLRALLDAYGRVTADQSRRDERLRSSVSQAEELERSLLPGQQSPPLGAQLLGSGRISVLDAGSLPTSPDEDPRPRDAAWVGLVGGAVGAGTGVLLGRRCRRVA